MDTIDARVQGSAPDPYTITVAYAPGTLHMNCGCPAGELGQLCKHRLAILSGDFTKVVAGAEQLKAIAKLMDGSPTQQMLTALINSEAALERAKREVSAAKRALGKALEIPGA